MSKKTQAVINEELDEVLKDSIFNGDITSESSAEDIRAILTSEVQVTEEQWRFYAVHCLI